MHSTDSMIVVVNRAQTDAENLKELIEFMDAPRVCAATPGRWRQQVGDCRLAAVFVGPDLGNKEIDAVLSGVKSIDPNVPIVMLHGADN